MASPDIHQYRPPKTVERFLLSNARRRVIMGPFGSGKSSGCVVEVPRRASMQQRGPDGYRRTRWAIVRNTMPQLRDTTMKTWFEWFPNGSIGYWKETGKTFFIEYQDVRAEVLFRALDDEDDVKNLLSLELTGAYINECREIVRPIVDSLDGRIDRYPSRRDSVGATWAGIWADTNPPTEDEYWYHLISGNDPDTGMPADNGWDAYIQPSGLSPEAENVEHLPPGYYENLARGKTKDFVRVYVKGEFGKSLSGKPVHPTFDPDIHVSKNELIPNKFLKLIVAADFGLTPAIVLKQQDTFGRVLTLDEIVTENMGLQRAIDLKLKPLLRNKYDGFDFFVTGDPAGKERSQNDERSCVDIFHRAGFKKVKFAYSNSPVHRIGATDSFLSRITEMGPAYLVDPRCSYLKKGLGGRYRYEINRKGEAATSPKKDIFSHVCEASQYGDMYFERGAGNLADKQERDAIAEMSHQRAAAHRLLRR